MSEHSKTETSKERKLLPVESEYIETMSDLLAKESGMDKHWIKNILMFTRPKFLLDAGRSQYKEYPGQLLYQFKPCLFEAMKWLDHERIKETHDSMINTLGLGHINAVFALSPKYSTASSGYFINKSNTNPYVPHGFRLTAILFRTDSAST